MSIPGFFFYCYKLTPAWRESGPPGHAAKSRNATLYSSSSPKFRQLFPSPLWSGRAVATPAFVGPRDMRVSTPIVLFPIRKGVLPIQEQPALTSRRVDDIRCAARTACADPADEGPETGKIGDGGCEVQLRSRPLNESHEDPCVASAVGVLNTEFTTREPTGHIFARAEVRDGNAGADD